MAEKTQGPCFICVNKMPFVLLLKELNNQYSKVDYYWAPFTKPGGPPQACFQCESMHLCMLDLMERCRMVVQDNLFKCTCGNFGKMLEANDISE